METADFRDRSDPPGLPEIRLGEAPAYPSAIPGASGSHEIVHKTLKMPVQASFIEHHHLIQVLAANGADQPFDICPLPGRGKCCKPEIRSATNGSPSTSDNGGQPEEPCNKCDLPADSDEGNRYSEVKEIKEQPRQRWQHQCG